MTPWDAVVSLLIRPWDREKRLEPPTSAWSSDQEASVDLATLLPSVLEPHPTVTSVRLIGSRAEGTPTQLSDWDFQVDTVDFKALAHDLPALLRPLEPLGQQWDPLSPHANYMLMLRGPSKVDLIWFNERFVQRPPWTVTPETLSDIEHHFWDWVLWLRGKHLAGKHDLVNDHLPMLAAHLLAPMGSKATPSSLEAAIEEYEARRSEVESELGLRVDRSIEHEVRPALRRAGFAV